MAEILTAKNGAVGTITISNPTKMNAMSVQMWTDLPKAIRAFDADPEVRVIVITGVGDKAFVSGADISQFDKLRSSAKTQDDYDNAVADSMVAPLECSKPIIGKIRGFCFGGGLGLAAACDIRICSEDATFRMPAARLGLGYGHKGDNALLPIESVVLDRTLPLDTPCPLACTTRLLPITPVSLWSAIPCPRDLVSDDLASPVFPTTRDLSKSPI